jgi:hypothetical protein
MPAVLSPDASSSRLSYCPVPSVAESSGRDVAAAVATALADAVRATCPLTNHCTSRQDFRRKVCRREERLFCTTSHRVLDRNRDLRHFLYIARQKAASGELSLVGDRQPRSRSTPACYGGGVVGWGCVVFFCDARSLSTHRSATPSHDSRRTVRGSPAYRQLPERKKRRLTSRSPPGLKVWISSAIRSRTSAKDCPARHGCLSSFREHRVQSFYDARRTACGVPLLALRAGSVFQDPAEQEKQQANSALPLARFHWHPASAPPSQPCRPSTGRSRCHPPR